MHWLRRIGRTPPPVRAVSHEARVESLERATPGVAAMLEGVGEDRSHAVLDLGSAADSALRVYSRFARRVRFADLLGRGDLPRGSSAIVRALPEQPEQPYDLLFAWDILDRFFPEERPRLVQRLLEISAPGARLHVVVKSSEKATRQPLRFTLLDVNRMRCEPSGPPGPGRKPLLPAQVEQILEPFHVLRAFTLKGGLREYVAIRRDEPAEASGELR